MWCTYVCEALDTQPPTAFGRGAATVPDQHAIPHVSLNDGMLKQGFSVEHVD